MWRRGDELRFHIIVQIFLLNAPLPTDLFSFNDLRGGANEAVNSFPVNAKYGGGLFDA